MEKNERLTALGAAIREERVRQRISQTTFALMIGSDQSYLSKVERGQYNLKYDRLCEIADALGVPVGALTDRVERPTEASPYRSPGLTRPPS